jgi:hypothetical protein
MGDLKCVRVKLERSSPHFFFYLFYSNRKIKIEQTRALPAKTLGRLHFYYYYHYYDYYYFIYLFILLLLKICSPNFFWFNSSKAKVRLQCIPSLGLSPY